MFVALGVLLKVPFLLRLTSMSSNDCQATKGVSGLYDVIETVLEKFGDYFERIKAQLEPPAPPSRHLMKIFMNTMVHVITTLAIVTKYCDIIGKDAGFHRAAKTAFRRASKSRDS